MKEKVAVYFRCSTDRQDNSIEDQRRTVVDFASKNNMEIVSWFDKDEGKSGTSFEKRSDFMQMIRLVESGQAPFRKILVYDVDRWGRPIDPRESTYWEYHCKRFGVDIFYIVDQSVNQNTLAGRLTKVIKQELATDESRKQSLRVRERSKLRAQEGYRVGGFAPYGYKRLLIDKDGGPVKVLEDGQRKVEKSQRVILTIGDEKECEVVRRIFELKASGMGFRGIANLLNQEGINSPDHNKLRRKTNVSGKWCMGTVRSMIMNPAYYGATAYNRSIRGNWVKFEKPGLGSHGKEEWIIKENTHTGIVSKDLYVRANKPLKSSFKKIYRGRAYSSNYLLTGLIVCKECGYNFMGHVHTNKYGAWRYYEDSGFMSRGRSVCGSFHVPKELIEDFVIQEIKKKVLSSLNIERVKILVENKLKELLDLSKPKLGEIDRELKEIEQKMENIKDCIEGGISPELVNDRIDKLEKKRLVLESQKIALNSCPVQKPEIKELSREVINFLDGFEDVFTNGSVQEKKERVRAFVSNIEVDKAKNTATCFIRKIPELPKRVNFLTYSDLRQEQKVNYTERLLHIHLEVT